MALVWLAGSSAATAKQPAARQPDLAQAEQALVERSNVFRQSQGLLPTRPDARLSAAAAEFAAYMARTDRYGHDADGRQPQQRAQAHAYAHCMVAENIAYRFNSAGFDTAELAQGFVQGWIDSPGHRRNLLAAEATHIGAAIARSPRTDRYYAVQMFGRPAALRLRFEISNRSSQALHYQLGDTAYSLGRGATRWHEHCSAPTLSLALPGQDRPTTLQPADGARYRIEAVGQSLRVVAD
ncbi:MAG TPA: CAP domain-containing protein [Aquabacterium sp.]|nr:CAP domain-containing protein [Aquabacterium sp.]